MKIKRVMIITVLFVMMLGMVAYARTPENPLFIGEVVSVDKSENGKEVKVTVDGFIKTNDVYKEKIITIVTDETDIEDCSGKKLKKEEIMKGNGVLIVLGPDMTKSIPPQASVMKMQVCKIKK